MPNLELPATSSRGCTVCRQRGVPYHHDCVPVKTKKKKGAAPAKPEGAQS